MLEAIGKLSTMFPKVVINPEHPEKMIEQFIGIIGRTHDLLEDANHVMNKQDVGDAWRAEYRKLKEEIS